MSIEISKGEKLFLSFARTPLKPRILGNMVVTWQSEPSEFKKKMAIFLTCYFSFTQLLLEIKVSILKFGWITIVEGNRTSYAS